MIPSFEKFLLKSPISVIVKLMNQLMIELSAPLNSQDSPHQTYGCRCWTYINCGSNSMENVCAFVRADIICLKPPTRWAKQYEKLLKIPKSKIPERTQAELEEITKLLEEQNPKDLNKIFDQTVKLLNEHKHLIK